MNEFLPYLISLSVGIGLAAATGFRIFTPFFLLSLATYLNWIPANPEWEWIGSQATLIGTAVAMVIETIAYYFPFVDNLLDGISVPLATIAGTTLFASQFTELTPFIQWSAAIIAGGGTAAAIGTSFAGTRAASSGTTGGFGNPIISTIEAIGSGIMSFLAIFAPIIAILASIIIIFFAVKIGKKFYRKLSSKST